MEVDSEPQINTNALIEKNKKIIESDPKNKSALNKLGVLYAQIGKFEDSIKHFETLIRLEPNNERYWNNLGEAYRRIKNHHKANVCRMRAIQIQEQNK